MSHPSPSSWSSPSPQTSCDPGQARRGLRGLRGRARLLRAELVGAAVVIVALLIPLLLILGGPSLVASSSHARDDVSSTRPPVGPSEPVGPVALRVQVLATVPHDPTAFTQGLEVAGDTLLEGTGLRGRSQLRELDPATGTLRRAVDLPPALFGEGVTVDGPTVWQLTWTDRVALARDRTSLAVVRTAPLEREGWGICRHHDHLVTSDGTDQLVLRDRTTFAPRESISVRAAGAPVVGLNELECTPEGVWANVWPTDRLVRIDPNSGAVTAVVDTAGLLPPEQRAGADVANGIAAIPGTDQYWLTGKLWPTTFRVRFTPTGPPQANPEQTHTRRHPAPDQATHPASGARHHLTGPASPSAIEPATRNQRS